MSELKACPFCGESDPSKFTIDKAWHNTFVRCWKCNATGSWQYGDMDENESAIAAWNRRADDAGRLREQQWQLRFNALEDMIASRDEALTECRRLVNKMLGGGKFDRDEWRFLAKLPASPSAEPCRHSTCTGSHDAAGNHRQPAPAKEDEKR